MVMVLNDSTVVMGLSDMHDGDGVKWQHGGDGLSDSMVVMGLSDMHSSDCYAWW